MTRQIIDIGANANDGTGEPLRQAFQAVNDNFANVWAAGPVDSQVVISNNVISTNVTNLELILAGNGIGTVTVESTVVPKIDSVYDLGSPSQQFDSVYARYFYGNGRYLTGISGGSGGGSNVYFRSSPPLNPNIGDIWIDSDTAVQYLYFNDNTSNQWAEMEAYQSFSSGGGGTGNVDLTEVNSDILPQMSMVYSLGNATNQWSNVHSVEVYANSYFYSNGNPFNAVAGSNTQIQFNDQGNLGAVAGFTFDTASNVLAIPESVAIGTDAEIGIQTTSGPNQLLINALNGNITLSAANGTNWNFDIDGILTTPGDGGDIVLTGGNITGANVVSANLYLGDGGQLSNVAVLSNLEVSGTVMQEKTSATETYISISPSGAAGWAFLTLPNDATANVDNTRLYNSAGNVEIGTGDLSTGSTTKVWAFGSDGNLVLPSTTVESTPVNPGFSNQTQKSVRGAIETVAGNPLPSYSNTLNQTQTIWTATNSDVTSAKMTLRIQYSVGPVIGMEMCDVVLAKEWGTNANVSYVISNRLRTNNSLSYANVVVDLDGSDNLIVNVTNSSGTDEYYSYSVIEFNRTND